MGRWLPRKVFARGTADAHEREYEFKDLFRGWTGATLNGALTWMEQIFDASVGHDFSLNSSSPQ